MPTGYTANVGNGKITTLKEFAHVCARGMGALISMRDEPFDAPIPKAVKCFGEYNAEKLDEAKQRIRELDAMTDKEKVSACAAEYQEGMKHTDSMNRRREQQRDRYEDMLSQVRKWRGAPDGLKEFMIQQLTESINFDCGGEPYAEPAKQTPDEWFEKAYQKAAWDINYHSEELQKARARTAENNAWLTQLHKSLVSS